MWWEQASSIATGRGEAWQWELQLLLWDLQPINRTCLHRKGKCLHCLCCFPEFWQEERKGRNTDTAVKSLPWALPFTRAGKRRGPCSFTLPRTPLSCLAHSRMSGTWVNHNATNSPTIFPRNSLRLGPLPSLSHILRELWTPAQGVVICVPVLWGKKAIGICKFSPSKVGRQCSQLQCLKFWDFYWVKNLLSKFQVMSH